MSLFENKDVTVTDALSQLVGEGKKFKTVEDLAQAKLESDRHIEQLEEEHSGYRKELEARATVEEALKKLQNEGQTANTQVTTETTTQDRQSVSEELDLDKLVGDKIAAMNAQTQGDANELEADRIMTERFGDAAKTELVRITREKGISLADAKDLARKSPAAFSSLMGLDTQTQRTPNLMTNGVQTETRETVNNSSAIDKELEELKALRKTDRKAYWSPTTQNRIMTLTAQKMQT